MSTPAKRALLIGINEYPNLPAHLQLDGCCNDVELMRSVLLTKFGFEDGFVRMIQNREATREGVLSALDQLVDATGTDDIVVIHYAGHGSQIRDREGDEADGLDETLVPSDTARAPAPNRDITDDELHLRLTQLAAKTPYTTLIFDCCHSGTISRDLNGAKPRQIEPDLRPIEELPPSPIPSTAARGEVKRDRGPSGWMPLSDRYVLISGCRDEEQSYEHIAETGGESVAHGALTYFLTTALLHAVPGTTYRDIVEEVRAIVSSANAEQHPQMEGAIDREVFGVRDIEPMRFVLVETRTGDVVTLAAGAAHGLRVGSTWAIHPAGAKQADAAAQLGEITITNVGATRSEGKITTEGAAGSITERTRAVEVRHAYGDLRLAIRLEGDRAAAPVAWDAVRAGIEASGVLRLTEAAGPAVRVTFVPVRQHVAAEDAVPQLGPTVEPVIAVVSETGELMMPPHDVADYEQVIKNLDGWAAFRMKLAIDNPGSELARTLSLELMRKGASGDWEPIEADPAGGLRVVNVGDIIEIRLSNRGSETLFAGLFDFRPTGEVKRLFPMGGREPIEPGQSMMLGRGRGFRASWVSGFPFIPNPFIEAPAEATETLKVFVTTEETDFAYLEQESASRTLRMDSSPFHLLLAATKTGATRNLEPVPPDDWATVSLPFTLRATAEAALDAKAAVAIGGVEVRTHGTQGRVSAHGGEGSRRAPKPPGAGRLDSALSRNQLRSVQTLALGSVSTASRAAGEEAGVELAVKDPGPGWGQLIMSTDEAGVVGWHFADNVQSGRVGSRSLADGRATFRIPCRSIEPEPGAETPASRGVAGVVGKKLLKVLVFPLMDPVFGAVGEHFAARFEEHRRPYGLRTFTPDDYRNETGVPIAGEAWQKLSSGRALLFVHGTFSRANHAFHGLPPEVVRRLHEVYEGRVFAFDHKTLSEDPRKNVSWLLGQLPDGTRLDLDIVCHSRGGLVSRVLAERGEELAVGDRNVRVGRVIFVAAPNAGTALADPRHMGEFLESYTNLLNFFDLLPDNGVTDLLDGIVTVAKQAAIGALGGLEGLRAMQPDGTFERWLAESKPNDATKYFAVASDFAPETPGLRELFLDRLMDKVFGGVANDLVVPTASVYEAEPAPRFPIVERLVLKGPDAVGHSGYFAAPGVQRHILSWLEGSA